MSKLERTPEGQRIYDEVQADIREHWYLSIAERQRKIDTIAEQIIALEFEQLALQNEIATFAGYLGAVSIRGEDE